MKDYLKLHENQASYDTWKTSDSYVTLNVSLIEDLNGVMYNPNGGGDNTPVRYLTFRAGSDNSSFGLKTIATDHKVYYSKDLKNWKPFDTEEDVTINNGEEAYVIGDADGVTFSTTSNKTTFRMTGSISVTGDITSILDYKTLDEKIAPSCYYDMFRDCTALTQAPTLPAITLADTCYASMFQGCTSLTQAPTLPAKTLAIGCCNSMFYGCTSLTQAPALPAKRLANWCYKSMFGNCTNLSSITCLATNISASNSTYNWLSGVSATGTFTMLGSTEWTSGPSGIPNGWTIVYYHN